MCKSGLMENYKMHLFSQRLLLDDLSDKLKVCRYNSSTFLSSDLYRILLRKPREVFGQCVYNGTEACILNATSPAFRFEKERKYFHCLRGWQFKKSLPRRHVTTKSRALNQRSRGFCETMSTFRNQRELSSHKIKPKM